jgi:thiamine-phosphate pyrophosphorylase
VHAWLADARLWLVLDRAAAAPRSLPEVTAACIAGGVDAVVFRMKDATPQEALPVAQEVRKVCRGAGVPFVLSRFVTLVDTLQPDALHLGAADGALSTARLLLPQSIALGYSAHSVAEAELAHDSGADYVFLGPIFDTPSKRDYGAPLGLPAVEDGSRLETPVIFIGGINATTLPQAVAAGAKRVAAISALQADDDPTAAALCLRNLLMSNRTD